MIMEMHSKSEQPRASSAVESFHLELHGSANGLILIANGRRYVVQLQADTEEAFQEVLDAIETAYLAHRERFYKQPVF